MDPPPQFICMLQCRSLTRYALTSKEKLTKILRSFLIVGNEIGLFQNDPQQWEFLAQGARLLLFTKWVLPLILASHRLNKYKPLWVVEPQPASPGQVVQAKGTGKGCRVNETPYHTSLRHKDHRRINAIIGDVIHRHYGESGKDPLVEIFADWRHFCMWGIWRSN